MASEVLDASAFYAGTAFLLGKECYTTSLVLEEIRHIKSAALDGLIDAGNLKILDPDPWHLSAVKKVAEKTGDLQKLSKADISVLALAMHLGTALVTDDYALANVAATIGIRVSSSSGKALKETRKWTVYCSACGKAFGIRETECPLCGNKLKRRYRITG
ncbi:NOB1 family endonuclease [Nitrososphaera sp.]|uniref:NOB1 family endonuclease n=1 Tax=Nitrososphaera sp. TaxID=1971748 RepID=UPI002ED8F31D